MTGFLSKLFGGKKKEVVELSSETGALVSEILEGLIQRAGLALQFKVKTSPDEKEEIRVELEGEDSGLLIDREGQLLEALQLYVKRAVQHRLPEDRSSIVFDTEGYIEESNQALVDLAEKLKNMVLEKNRSVYCRALPPKDRKIIHQYLAGDNRVRSKSIGEGLYKKIKIYPVKASSKEGRDTRIISNQA